MSFDSRTLANRPQTPEKEVIWLCQICENPRFSWYEIAYEGAVVIVTETPTSCEWCGDGCLW